MSNKFPHVCIKPGCGNPYKDEDPEAYYCPSCVAQNKIIAKEIDAKRVGRTSLKPQSDFKILEERGRTRGAMTLVRASDLGIQL